VQTRLKIFSAAFVAIFTALQVQPLFVDINVAGEVKGSCSQTMKPACTMNARPACSKTKTDPVKQESDENGDCRDNACNPFVPCSLGFCCYLVENFISHLPAYTFNKPELLYFDDNRLSGNFSECWHPPEMIS